MSSQIIIHKHDLWRKGIGGAPAGLIGQSDSNHYAGLDLNLAQFASTTFTGSSFTATTFKQAGWTACRFTGCTFTGCDFEGISISDCTFDNCTFAQSQFKGTRFTASKFNNCQWNGLNFDGGYWSQVDVLGCTGTTVQADSLRGEHVDFTGSYFENLEFRNASINN
ncbi:pentapeptide repeat-containing protein [Variovorax rhizosphaerae]|uniref:Pentapeptide repeat-containing protein n=1 Tax=Variovorax rhizosphaerae TaxID=1836200 RepID=A0ABU8WY01_9BURK